MAPILSVTNLSKKYIGSEVFSVDQISFSLGEGEILGLLGPNGSGKTTTIQMLLGTLAYSSGSICYFGKELIDDRSAVLQQVTFASAYTSLPWSLSIEENLEVFGYLYGMSRKESRARFLPLLERFQIADKRRSAISSLSAGQVTRLMLVKAFFSGPRIVLLDEPTASLDPEIASDICSFILEQQNKTGVSILFTSHKMEEVMQICDRTIFLKNGKIIADDLPEKLVKSIATFHLHLTISEGMDKAIDLLHRENKSYICQDSCLDITLDEVDIAPLLQKFSAIGALYSHIKIEEPSLEDFFLHVAKNSL
jgi:ABC-2 type transport system ATP-binding protein